MIEVQAPLNYSQHTDKKKIFLAGSIEMGRAVEWQKRVVEDLEDIDVVLLNPRRRDWDSSWEHSINHLQFRQQVEWELQALDDSDIIVMYFDPETKSPITLMELGIHAATNPGKVIVCCPDGFWRKGNIDIVCARYGVAQVEDLNDLIFALRDKLGA